MFQARTAGARKSDSRTKPRVLLTKIFNTLNILIDAAIETGSGNNMRIEYNLEMKSGGSSRGERESARLRGNVGRYWNSDQSNCIKVAPTEAPRKKVQTSTLIAICVVHNRPESASQKAIMQSARQHSLDMPWRAADTARDQGTLAATRAFSYATQPRLHAKVLAWDNDNLAVTSQNWLSADPSDAARRSEIGVFVESNRIADH